MGLLEGWTTWAPGLGRCLTRCLPSCTCFSPQTKDALLKILDDMRGEDYLNFILFSSGVTIWKDHLVQATPENLQEARKFVKSIRDQGSKQT